MRNATFSFQIPNTQTITPPLYVELSTVGTPLDGLAAGAAVVLTPLGDYAASGPIGGNGFISVRASAADTLRFGIKAANLGQTISVLVTELT